MQRFEDQINSRNSSGNDSLWGTLRRPEIYKPLAIINAFFAFQQFSGTFVIVVYAAQFAEEAGTGIDKFLCTVLIGIARVIATIILAYFILDRYGRKPPSIFSGVGKSIIFMQFIFSSHIFLNFQLKNAPRRKGYILNIFFMQFHHFFMILRAAFYDRIFLKFLNLIITVNYNLKI